MGNSTGIKNLLSGVSRERLTDLYWGQSLSLTKIARILDVSRSGIHQYMSKLGIPCRDYNQANSLIWANPETREKQALSHRVDRGGKVIKICGVCGTVFEIPRAWERKGGGKFCSKGCRDKAFKELYLMERSPNWQGGKSFEPYGIEFNNILKERVRARDNYTCQICGVQENDYYRKLDVHHIDGRKKNNSLENLITLCESCHIHTHRQKILILSPT